MEDPALTLAGRRFDSWDELTDAIHCSTVYWSAHHHPFGWGKCRRHCPPAQSRMTFRMHALDSRLLRALHGPAQSMAEAIVDFYDVERVRACRNILGDLNALVAFKSDAFGRVQDVECDLSEFICGGGHRD